MNRKKAGWLYFIMIILFIGVSAGLSLLYLQTGFELPMLASSFISEALIWVPALLMLVAAGENPISFCRFRKIKISSALMLVLYAFLIMPAATLMNILSMFFVDNAVTSASGAILQAGFLPMFLDIALYSPLSEEIGFRGALLQSFQKDAAPFKAILVSSLLFGIMHLNFNQAPYAFVLGIAMAVAVEATGSIWASFLIHFTVNARSVIIMFAEEALLGGSAELLEAAGQTVTNELLVQMLCLEILMVVIFLPVAACVLVWVSKNEKRENLLKSIFTQRRGGKIWSVPLTLTLVIALIYMIIRVVL